MTMAMTILMTMVGPCDSIIALADEWSLHAGTLLQFNVNGEWRPTDDFLDDVSDDSLVVRTLVYEVLGEAESEYELDAARQLATWESAMTSNLLEERWNFVHEAMVGIAVNLRMLWRGCVEESVAPEVVNVVGGDFLDDPHGCLSLDDVPHDAQALARLHGSWDCGSYVVGRGDVMWMVAAAFGRSAGILCRENGIRDCDRIEIGQVIVIDFAQVSSGGSTDVVRTVDESDPILDAAGIPESDGNVIMTLDRAIELGIIHG